MKIVQTAKELQEIVLPLSKAGKTIGFVPTMGALHEGHGSLIKKAKEQSDICVASIFVNPTQFGPTEDFAKYPRPIEKDQALASSWGVDLLFLPSAEEMYPDGQTLFVEEMKLSKQLCGASRPGHFRGVCTVVTKLLQIVSPHILFLGKKDAQQLRIIQHLVHGLFLPVKVVGVDTYREANGLAMSSRNQYLSPKQKEEAAVLYQGLQAGLLLFQKGEKQAQKIIEATQYVILQNQEVQIEYVELVCWDSFSFVPQIQNPSLLALAAKMHGVRLIDNVFLEN